MNSLKLVQSIINGVAIAGVVAGIASGATYFIKDKDRNIAENDLLEVQHTLEEYTINTCKQSDWYKYNVQYCEKVLSSNNSDSMKISAQNFLDKLNDDKFILENYEFMGLKLSPVYDKAKFEALQKLVADKTIKYCSINKTSTALKRTMIGSGAVSMVSVCLSAAVKEERKQKEEQSLVNSSEQ